jgi:acetyl-CoA acetyltransferase
MDIWPEWMEKTGQNLTPFAFASRARRHMALYGTTREQFARVIVKNRKQGVLNPNAMWRNAVTEEEVLSAPIVCDPLTSFMLCSPNEGAAALILTTESKAKQYTTKPVYVAAAAVGTPIEGSIFGGTALPQIHGVTYTDNPYEITSFVSNKAYEEAGMGPKDLDIVELQDTDAASEIIETELLGICAMGEAPRLIDEGITAFGSSKRPIVNISGGLTCKGEPVGASGLAMIGEIVYQLRGEAGPRQLEGARAGLGQTIGMGGNCSVVIVKS